MPRHGWPCTEWQCTLTRRETATRPPYQPESSRTLPPGGHRPPAPGGATHKPASCDGRRVGEHSPYVEDHGLALGPAGLAGCLVVGDEDGERGPPLLLAAGMVPAAGRMASRPSTASRPRRDGPCSGTSRQRRGSTNEAPGTHGTQGGPQGSSAGFRRVLGSRGRVRLRQLAVVVGRLRVWRASRAKQERSRDNAGQWTAAGAARAAQRLREPAGRHGLPSW